jgi:cytochrome c556
MKRIATFLLIALPAIAAAADAPENVTKYRQIEMRAMGSHMSVIGLVTKGQISDRSILASEAQAIHAISTRVHSMFPPGTGPDKAHTDAKVEIWSQAKRFDAETAKLERESAKLVQLAGGNDTRAFAAQFQRVGAACNSCHDAFRVRDTE